MLKCGQKNNTKYTFGITKEQKEEIEKEAMITMYCSSCSAVYKKGSKFCSNCGKEI